jgi:hypothetical protein
MTITAPTLNLVSIGSIDALNGVPPGMTFTRALGTATRVNAQGRIETVAADVLRHNYDPVTKEHLGWLTEGAATNVHWYSADLNTNHVALRSTVDTDGTLAPDGSGTDGYLETIVSNTHGIFETDTVSASTTYNVSRYLKYRGRAFAIMYMNWNVTGETSQVGFNIQTGVVGITTSSVGASDPTNALIEDVGGGWYRCSYTCIAPVGESSVNCTVYGSDADDRVAFVGDVTKGMYVWGQQLTAGGGLSSYIPTLGANATRSADILTLNPGISSTKMSLYVEFSYSDGHIGTRAVVTMENGNSTPNWELQFTDNGATTDNWNIIARDDTAQFFSSGNVTITVPATSTTSVKMMFAGENINSNMYRDGAVLPDGPVITPTDAFPYDYDEMGIGHLVRSGPQAYLFGHIKHIQYWPVRLSNEELLELTL